LQLNILYKKVTSKPLHHDMICYFSLRLTHAGYRVPICRASDQLLSSMCHTYENRSCFPASNTFPCFLPKALRLWKWQIMWI